MSVFRQKPDFWKTTEELYLEWLTERCGSQPTLQFFPTSSDQHPPIYVAGYADFPSPGLRTWFTVGMSSVPGRDRQLVRKELVLSLATHEDAWGRALGTIAANFRSERPFECGETVALRDQIVEGSPMHGFLINHQTVLPYAEQEHTIRDRYIRIVQLYPLHTDEMTFVHEHGADPLIDAAPDVTDPGRPSAADAAAGSAVGLRRRA
jgi:hypothetical protein